MDNKHNKSKPNKKITTIITDAVCGKKSQTYKHTIYVDIDDIAVPSQILGCTIRNAKICKTKFEEVTKKHANIRIEGEFEVHIWYDENGNTHIAKSQEQFSDIICVPIIACDDYSDKDILARIIKSPVCLGTMIINKCGCPNISIQVEYELGVEIIGEARLNVLCFLDYDDKEKCKDIDFGSDDDFDDED